MKIIQFIFFILLLARPWAAQAQSNIADSSQKRIKIDIKTALDEKDKLKLVKAGLKIYIMQSEWAEVVNLGADYSLWLTRLHRKVQHNTIVIELDMEFKKPSVLGKDKLLERRHIKDTLDLEGAVKLSTIEERELYHLIMEQLAKRDMPKTLALAAGGAVVGATLPGVGTLVQKGLGQLSTELESKYRADQAIEAMVEGAVLFTRLKDMVDSVQAKK